MASQNAKDDIEMLLDMELKLQLLDTEGVVIPPTLPPIPPLPDNYNFCHNLWSPYVCWRDCVAIVCLL